MNGSFPRRQARPALPWADLPHPAPNPTECFAAPGLDDCRALWRRYAMLPNIEEHSLTVAKMALYLGRRLQDAGVPLCLKTLQASALLHDLAKTYTIGHGGNHTQLGAAWVVQETGQPLIAQGVLFHAFWPWELDLEAWPLPLLVQYADKLVRHDQVVDLKARFTDLMERYGKNERARESISRMEADARAIEHMLITTYKVDPYAYSADCGRLVQ